MDSPIRMMIDDPGDVRPSCTTDVSLSNGIAVDAIIVLNLSRVRLITRPALVGGPRGLARYGCFGDQRSCSCGGGARNREAQQVTPSYRRQDMSLHRGPFPELPM